MTTALSETFGIKLLLYYANFNSKQKLSQTYDILLSLNQILPTWRRYDEFSKIFNFILFF